MGADEYGGEPMNKLVCQNQKRMQDVDFAKGFAAFAVVIGHLVAYERTVFDWFFGFHMPFFFLLCGYMQKEKLPDFSKFIAKKFKRLLIPSWIYRLYVSLVGIMLLDEISLSLKEILTNVFWNATLEWFLPVMFLVSIGMYLYVLLYNRVANKQIFAIGSLLFISAMVLCCRLYPFHDTHYLPFKLDSAAAAFTFAIIGFGIKKAEVPSVCLDFYHSISKKSGRMLFLAGLLAAYTGLALVNSLARGVNMADSTVGSSEVTYYVVGSLMFVVLMFVGQLLNSSDNILVRWLRLLGRHSMMIYLVHGPINRIIIEIVDRCIDDQLNLAPMVNLNVMWIGVFFVTSMTILTGICLLIEWSSSFKKRKT